LRETVDRYAGYYRFYRLDEVGAILLVYSVNNKTAREEG
jgi:hypothetical protein